MGKIPGFLSAYKHAPQIEKVMKQELGELELELQPWFFLKEGKRSKTPVRKCQLIQTNGGRGAYMGKLQVSGYRMRWDPMDLLVSFCWAKQEVTVISLKWGLGKKGLQGYRGWDFELIIWESGKSVDWGNVVWLRGGWKGLFEVSGDFSPAVLNCSWAGMK